MEGKEEAGSSGAKKCIRVPEISSVGQGETSFHVGSRHRLGLTEGCVKGHPSSHPSH